MKKRLYLRSTNCVEFKEIGGEFIANEATSARVIADFNSWRFLLKVVWFGNFKQSSSLIHVPYFKPCELNAVDISFGIT